MAELADSIRAVGILEPLLVEPASHARGYVVIAGNRRLAAARLLGLVDVECMVRPRHDRSDHAAVRLIENGHRRALSPMEQARGFGQLRDDGLSQTEIAKRTGFSIPHVSQRLTLLELGAVTQDRVERGVLRADVAVAAVRSTRRPSQPDKPRHPAMAQPPPAAVPCALAPDHFGRGHPLSRHAGQRCRGVHGELRAAAGLGGIACGRCWETAIRADERHQVTAGVNPDRRAYRPESQPVPRHPIPQEMPRE